MEGKTVESQFENMQIQNMVANNIENLITTRNSYLNDPHPCSKEKKNYNFSVKTKI